MSETLICCPYCKTEVSRKSAGDESWDFCEECDKVIEGNTIELTEAEYEREHG